LATWEEKGKGRCRERGEKVNTPPLNPSYATTPGYSGPWL